MAYVRTGRERVFRNSGLRYIPRKKTPELDMQKRVCNYLRKNYPDVVFHSDFGASADLSEHQAKLNKALQSYDKFPDLTIFKTGRVNETTGVRYIGLAIELKKDGTTVILKTGPNKGRLTTNEHIREQAKTLRKLNAEGWYSNFAIGYDQAIRIIDWYFEKPQNTSLF